MKKIICTPLKYKEGYKYIQAEYLFVCETDIFPEQDIATKFISLTTDGVLTTQPYFATDGASGPTIDDKTNRRGAWAHDALYELMRQGLLDIRWRYKCDELLRDLSLQDAKEKHPNLYPFFYVRYNLWFKMVEWKAKKYATKKGENPVLTAP